MSERGHLYELAEEMLGGEAESKGYQGMGEPNHLYEVTGLDHAIGEVIYKAVRYRARFEANDLVKIVAWVALLWEQHHVER